MVQVRHGQKHSLKEFNLPAAKRNRHGMCHIRFSLWWYLRWSSISLFIKSSKQGENPENDEIDDVQEALSTQLINVKLMHAQSLKPSQCFLYVLLIGQYLDGLTKGTHFNYQPSYGVYLQV